ncbi:MAG: OPT/YSL family transporter, partial [Myxococcales bacterium]|nr:OPT/YSL family transporter [Myxococcales bacterium]
DMMQDLKTGHLLGASPRSQFKAQLFGIAAGVPFCVGAYMLVSRAYGFEGDDLPAPAAHAWKTMAELLAGGLETLPVGATGAVIAGLLFGASLPIARKLAPESKAWLPSGLAVGIAFIIPAFYSIAIALGALALVFWKRLSPTGLERLGFAVASGMVAGEGIMGLVNAILTLLGVEKLTGG